ncbi:MAG: hypothetical protein GC192_22420 [Bacteroidetes bacterium]|nr:hypothetical protein [Bacteroidota bacterium]
MAKNNTNMTAIDKKFYNLFWTDPICQTIFSSHKAQLLEDEVELIVAKEKFYAQRIVLTNSQKRRTGTQIAKRNENESIELIHKLQVATKKYFDEAKIDIYIKKKFGKAIKLIEKDLTKSGGWWKLVMKLVGSLDSEKDLFKLLTDYYLIPKEIETKEQFGKYLENEISSNIREFLKKENLSELAISIDLISTYYNYKIKNNLVSATKHYTDVFYDNENFQDRLYFFDNLYEIGVIKGGKLKSYYECVNCSPNIFNGVLTLDIKPTSLKMKCPSCSKELFYIVPYELDKVIYDNIVHKDGILFFAIQHILEQHKYKFISNYHQPPDVELDFCLLNDQQLIYEIIEVKMFKTDRPEDTQVGNIREAVSQTKKAIDKLITIQSEYKAIQKSIVTNINVDNIYKTAKKELEKDLKDYNIVLYTISDFYIKIKR